jgi:Toastrack DUF4097
MLMQRRLAGILGPTAAALTMLSGCGQPARVDRPVWLAVQKPVAVEVESFNGNVLISADPKWRPYAMIQVKRSADFGSGRKAAAKAAVDRIKHSAEIVQRADGPVLQVRTWTDDPEPWLLRADVRIFIPAVKGLTVHNGRGKVSAINIEGDVNVETTGGDVRVMTNLPMTRPVTITNRQGDIDYRVRGDSTGAFDCQAEGGGVDQRATLGHVIIHSGTNQDTLLATLNDGKNPVRLRTTDGDIRVAVVENPTDVGTLILTP